MFLYYPGRKFPSLSVTGSFCSLHCKHCNARYLQHMVPVTTPDALLKFVKKNEKRINGFLLSGGSTPYGKVPLKKFADAVRWIRKNTDLKVNIHTGIIDDEDMEYLEYMEPSHISFDVIGATETIREIIGIKRSKEDYFHSLNLLDSSSLNYSPHIIAGLHYGKILGEYGIIEKILSLKNFSNVILLVLIPTKGTPMENVEIDIPQIKRFFQYTLSKLPSSKVVLGCMRPRNLVDVEMMCIDAGCKGIVLPSLKTIKYMEKKQIKYERRELCCVF